jgi:hypothetical protein
VTDLLHFARHVPSEGVIGKWNIAELAALRESVIPKIGWSALFIKAFGLVSARCPVLRQIYMKWPVPHLYEHPVVVARMTVARKFRGEDWLFFARIVSPEQVSLVELQRTIDRFKDAPVESVPSFVRQIRLSGCPVFVRRPMWWWALNGSGARHAHRFGTFAMTSISSLGAVAVQPKCLSTTTLTYGPVDNGGNVDVRIVFDHRVFDGAVVADILARWERALKVDVANELRSLGQDPARNREIDSKMSESVTTVSSATKVSIANVRRTG